MFYILYYKKSLLDTTFYFNKFPAEMKFYFLKAKLFIQLNLTAIFLQNFSCFFFFFQVLEHKCQLLVTFGECRHFTATVLHLLCDTVQAYSEDLRDCVKNEKLPESKRFCNSYYIFWTVEHCLGKMDKLNSEEKLNIKNKLEDSLLYITEQFPLFAHAVWRICGLIS